MAYIGNEPVIGQWRKLDDISGSFNGSLTSFTTQVGGTNVTAGSANQLLVSLGGVLQEPGTDYSVSSSTITFTTAPAASLSFFAVLAGDALNTSVPADGSITTAKLGANLTVDLGLGSAGTPSLTFDADTGLFSGGDNQVNVSTSGVERAEFGASEVVFNDGGADYDFRVEGDTNANLLFVDASTDRVGIGTSSPTLSAGTGLHLRDGNTGIRLNPSSDGGQGYIEFADESDTVQYISGYRDANTTYNVCPGSSLAVASGLHIDTSGNVGIGTTSPSTLLHLAQSSGAAVMTLQSQDGVQASVVFGDTSDESRGRILYSNNNEAMQFEVNNLQEAMRIDSSGRLLVGTVTSPTDSINILAKGPVGGGGGGGCVGIGYAGSSGPGNGNTLGVLRFTANGDSTHAEIRVRQDGATWTDGSDQPTRLQFSTTTDGTSTPTSRFRIGSTGNTLFQNITNYVAPDSDNAISIGANGRRWSEVWAANGTIQTSDERAKNEITDATLGADFIKALRPVSYKWIEGGKRHTGEYDEDNNFVYESIPGARTHWGFIAQEVKQIVDDAGVDFGGWVLTDKDDPDSEQALRYDQFIAPLTKALQEALAKIETLEAKVAALEGN